tara:strand:- start:1940 stop:2350 length:411 start_codon:yes stop_codon:yes gene_type:complete
MNKYYFDFIKEKLKKDIIHELLKEGIDNELIHKEVNIYFEKEIHLTEIKQSSGTHQIRDRSTYQHKEHRCKARVWNEGEGGQCSFAGSDEYDGFCKTHFKKGGNEWYLGCIHKPRPERPLLPNGNTLTWNHLSPST